MLDACVAAIAAALGLETVGSRGAEFVEVGVHVVDVEEGWTSSAEFRALWARILTNIVVSISINASFC